MKFISATLAALLAATSATQAFAASPVGVWAAPTYSVAIAPCLDHGQQKLCGKLFSLAKPLDARGNPVADSRNPNPALRNKPIVGSTMLTGFSPAGEGRWTNGKIYNADDGRTYDSKMTLLSGDQLSVEGCVVVFCKSQIWRRVVGAH